MRRRDFVAMVGAAALGSPTLTRAQRLATPAIGFLSGGSSHGAHAPDLDGLRQGLVEGGYIEGRTVIIEYGFADGHFDRLPALASDLVSRRVAVIATVTLPAAMAAKAATPTIPVVFVIGEDPVKAGLVASLNRPGGNATGVSDFINQLGAKRLELIRQAVPRVALIGLLVNSSNPNAEPDAKEVEAAANGLGQKLLIVKATSDRDLEAAFTTLAQERAGALCVNIDPFFFGAQDQIIALAARYRLPAIYPRAEFVKAGGLMSYSPNRFGSWRQAGLYAARMLHGEKPADLPVQQATNVELVINVKTAKALGLTIPQTLLLRADEVIQ
jgi:putative ABC transport system substrate-binding protein